MTGPLPQKTKESTLGSRNETRQDLDSGLVQVERAGRRGAEALAQLRRAVR